MESAEPATSENIPKMMKAVVFHRACKALQLEISDWPTPVPKENEVLIRVRAFGLNFADTSARKGQYMDAPPFPCVVGYEVSGTVASFGSACKGFNLGQKVIGFTNFGGYAEYTVAIMEVVYPLPATWSYADGAAVPVVYVTAYHSFLHTGLIQPGDRVLIHACAGGLGLACLQLAKLYKCEVFGTCGSDAKVKLLQEKGVDHAINYSTQEFDAEVKKITNGQGVDITIDSIGGSYIKRDLSITRAGGRVIGCGGAGLSERGLLQLPSLVSNALSMSTLNGIEMLLKAKSVCGVNMKQIADNRPDIVQKCLVESMKLFESGQLTLDKPTEMDWKDIGKAHDLLETRRTTGKIVLIIPE